MLTRMLAVFAVALAVIGLAAAAPMIALAQSSGDATATATATPTPAATPSPGPTSFALKPHTSALKPRGLTRIGDKWHVAGFNAGYIHIFNDNGTYARRIKAPPVSIRGLTTDGTNLIAVSGGVPSVYTWPPQANDATVPTPASRALHSPPGGGTYLAQGIAHDGANTWVAVQWPRGGSASSKKYGLLKINATQTILHRTNKPVSGLTYQNNYLYGLLGVDIPNSSSSENPDLARISTTATALQPYTAAALVHDTIEPPMNNWEVTRRTVGIRGGLDFRNSTAYGFNNAYDEVRQARQPSPERLFSLTPHISTLNPRGLTRIGDKWHVAGFNAGYIHIFNDNGTYARRIKAPPVSIRGLTTDGTNLIAVSGGVPSVYTWPPQANDATVPTPASRALHSPPGGGTYLAQGIAHDGANTWVAVQWPRGGSASSKKYGLLKINATQTILHRTNKPVSGLTYQNNYLYGLLGVDIPNSSSSENPDLARISTTATALQPYTAAALVHDTIEPPMNNWEVTRRTVGIRGGLDFRNSTAYGFNNAYDEVRQARAAATTTAAPAAATTTASSN